MTRQSGHARRDRCPLPSPSEAPIQRLVALLAPAILVVGCAGTRESSARRNFDNYPRPERAARTQERAQHASGALESYLRVALRSDPQSEAAFARWEASVLRVTRARRLPDPVIRFGYFLSSVETRVGPQRGRVGLEQAFPWPTKLSAGSDAVAMQAQAMQRRFEAEVLRVAERVEEAYWSLWLVREKRKIRRDHLLILTGLSETVLGRLATGAANLAEQQQVDLSAARLEDQIATLGEQERTAIATLAAACGVEQLGNAATTSAPPTPSRPKLSELKLRELARSHPSVVAYADLAAAQDAAAEAEAADALPGFTIGAEWIITGEARMPNVPDSGKDAVVVGAGVRVPLWQGSYSDSEDAARAEARAYRADRRAASNRSLAQLDMVLSRVRDSARRARLIQGTLLPQAQTAYESVLGAYAVGRGSVAQALLAQRDLLELRLDWVDARAEYARAWAKLEEVTGRRLEAAMDPQGTNDVR